MKVLLFCAGALVGYGLNSLIHLTKRATGILRIDHSNPEKDVYRFEIDDIDKLSTKNIVVLKVDHNADLSQE